jgi:hypothetical protein
MLGGPYWNKLAPLYEEFVRCRDLLDQEFQMHLLDIQS